MKVQWAKLIRHLITLFVGMCFLGVVFAASFQTIIMEPRYEMEAKQEIIDGCEYFVITQGRHFDVEHKGNCKNPIHSGARDLSQAERQQIYQKELDKRIRELQKEFEQQQKKLEEQKKEIEERKKSGVKV